jgi:putative spermidine/putrescine transport system permease protein
MTEAPRLRGRRPGDAVSTLLYRRRRLALWLLLAPPLLWFGVVFVGARLALVWQSTYTFHDFAMQVTSRSGYHSTS